MFADAKPNLKLQSFRRTVSRNPHGIYQDTPAVFQPPISSGPPVCSSPTPGAAPPSSYGSAGPGTAASWTASPAGPTRPRYLATENTLPSTHDLGFRAPATPWLYGVHTANTLRSHQTATKRDTNPSIMAEPSTLLLPVYPHHCSADRPAVACWPCICPRHPL